MTEETLFEKARNLPANERAAFLDRECQDPAVRALVDAMLAADVVSKSPLDRRMTMPEITGEYAPKFTPQFGLSSLGEEPQSDFQAGTIIAGKYTLIEPLGEGGMGMVWQAKQREPVKRFVAVKLIKAGMDSKQVLARFDAERQALAHMDHPNIAKVLDGGVHEGRPFFVMELVKGTPITRHCDANKLTPQQRLELFIPVCQAIQHAHQKGIIHRDIKPSNVLVALYDDKPVVKVIDFGVAKATGGALTEQTLDTGFGAVVGTPQYMSPEQATFNNLDIDTRSDVYSLGVLLYELLTGSPPFSGIELKKKGLMEILRVVREEDPPRPSTKLSTADALPSLSANRGTEPKKLTGLLRNELDWIVMKALEKDRTRRYDSANGFAADVLRYLGGETVLAHPPSLSYRLRKFVRRNKGQVLATGLVFAALVAGIIGTTLGLVEAKDQANLAKKNENQAKNESKQKDLARAAEAIQREIAQNAARETRESFNGFADTVTSSLYSPFLREPTANEKPYLDRIGQYYKESTQTSEDNPDSLAIRGQAHYYLALIATLQNDPAGLDVNLPKAEDLLSRASEERSNDPIIHRYLGLTRTLRIGKQETDRFYNKLAKDTGTPRLSPPLRLILTTIPIEALRSIYEQWRDLASRFPQDNVIRTRAAESSGKYAQTLFGATPEANPQNLVLHATLKQCLDLREEEVSHRRWVATRQPVEENWIKLRQSLDSTAETGLKLWQCKPSDIPMARRVLQAKLDSFRVLFEHLADGRDLQLTEYDLTVGTRSINDTLFDPEKWPDGPSERVTFWTVLQTDFPKARMFGVQIAHARMAYAEHLVKKANFADAQASWRESLRLAKINDMMVTPANVTMKRDPDGKIRPVEGPPNPSKGMKFLEGLMRISEACVAAKQWGEARAVTFALLDEYEALATLAKEPRILLSGSVTRATDLLSQAFAEDGRIDDYIVLERRRIELITANVHRVPHTLWQPVMQIASAHERLGNGLLKYNRPNEAVKSFRNAIDAYRKEWEIFEKSGGQVDSYNVGTGVQTALRIQWELRKAGIPEWREFFQIAYEIDTKRAIWKSPQTTIKWWLPQMYGHVHADLGEYSVALKAYREGMARDWPLPTTAEEKESQELRVTKRREHPLDQWAGIVLALDGKLTEGMKEIPTPREVPELSDYVRAALPALAGKPADTKASFTELFTRDNEGKNSSAHRELCRMASVVGADCGIESKELVRLAELGTKDESNAWGHHLRALAYLRSGDFEKALVAVAESRKADPKWRPALNELVLALITERQGKVADSRQHFITASSQPILFGSAPPCDVVEYILLMKEARYRIGFELAPLPRLVK